MVATMVSKRNAAERFLSAESQASEKRVRATCSSATGRHPERKVLLFSIIFGTISLTPSFQYSIVSILKTDVCLYFHDYARTQDLQQRIKVILLDFDGFNLHMLSRICYTMGGRMKQRFSCTVCETPPKSAPWGAFLFPYCEQGLTLRLVAVHSLVKPSAKVVADYPCRDGEKE